MIDIQPTPNPNALKFILDKVVKETGKCSFKAPKECEDIPLARALFDLRGVDQVHFFGNTITVSKFSFEPWDSLESAVITCIANHLEDHDPSFEVFNPEEERRKNLSPEMQQIEGILDKTIRPGLQGDGGDLETVSYEDNVLMIRYQGACGTCPSSSTGTLHAIRAILADEYNPHIEVYIAPEA